MRRQQWECPWNLILVILQFAILFFFIALRNACVDSWAEESLLLRDIRIVTIYLFGSHAAAMILMLACFHLIVGTVPKQIELSLYGMGREVWLAVFLVLLITVPANLSQAAGYVPPVMHLPDLSIIRLLQSVSGRGWTAYSMLNPSRSPSPKIMARSRGKTAIKTLTNTRAVSLPDVFVMSFTDVCDVTGQRTC